MCTPKSHVAREAMLLNVQYWILCLDFFFVCYVIVNVDCHGDAVILYLNPIRTLHNICIHHQTCFCSYVELYMCAWLILR